MNLNKIFILGRVTADPQSRTTPGGQTVLTLGVATNRIWFDKDKQKQEETEFHNVVLFGRQAEIAAQYLKKGSLALFEGRNRTRQWTDKDGNERRTTEIVCESLQLGPAPVKAEQAKAAAPSFAGPTRPRELAAEENIVPLDSDEEDNGRNFTPVFEEEEIKVDEIPF
jgi:single-strand DNA-binding protein